MCNILYSSDKLRATNNLIIKDLVLIHDFSQSLADLGVQNAAKRAVALQERVRERVRVAAGDRVIEQHFKELDVVHPFAAVLGKLPL